MRYNFICYNRFLPVVEVTVTGNNIKEAITNFNNNPQLVLWIDFSLLKESTIGNGKVWYYADDINSTRCIIFNEDSGYFNLHLYRSNIPTRKGYNYFYIYNNLISSLK